MRGELNGLMGLPSPANTCGDKLPRPDHLSGSRWPMAAHRMHKRQKLAGFTLTEVIIASTLLILAMVPILKALTSAITTSTIVEHRTRSLALAEAKLDEIRARSIYNYADDFSEDDFFLDGRYLCNVTDSSHSADVRRIVISVGHDTDGDSILKSGEIEVTLTTLLARRW